MSQSIFDIAPFIPSDKALETSVLPDLAMSLTQKSARLSGQLTDKTVSTLEAYMRVINSYYSNLIEGNATQPHEIREAQNGVYSEDPAKRDLQEESLGHMAVQEWLQNQSLDLGQIFSPDFIQQVHRQFYLNIPESLWDIKNSQGEIVGRVIPGQWRDQKVVVGSHVSPAAEVIPALMQQYCETYQSDRFKGDRRLIAIMAAHHRFAWIHPFLDGNGRVGRLITDAALKAAGLDSYGVWCLSRGLAHKSSQYKKMLALADRPRQGDYDGRGQLTEKGLLSFCGYMLETAIDQVDYMNGLLKLPDLRRRIEGYINARNDHRVASMDEALKPIAGLILHTAFIYGEISRAQAIELCAMPERSARRLLSQLKAEGLLSETSSKSPLRWEIPEHAEPWYFPELAPQV
ncbi:MAG: Fic family protein [Gammaproteobacteria bacterium]|nr:MAG: Fic family protein [Gammaproteobacteria bacterium]